MTLLPAKRDRFKESEERQNVTSVVVARIEPCAGHFHVLWKCPDCGSEGMARYDGEPIYVECEKTGRIFVLQVQGKPRGPAE